MEGRYPDRWMKAERVGANKTYQSDWVERVVKKVWGKLANGVSDVVSLQQKIFLRKI